MVQLKGVHLEWGFCNLAVALFLYTFNAKKGDIMIKEMTVSEYAAFISKSTSTVYRLISIGTVQTVTKANKKYVLVPSSQSTSDLNTPSDTSSKGLEVKELEEKIEVLEKRIEQLEKEAKTAKKTVKTTLKKSLPKKLKKVLKKATIKKGTKTATPKKVSTKKISPKKVVKKTSPKKAVKKVTPKKVIKKVIAKKSTKK